MIIFILFMVWSASLHDVSSWVKLKTCFIINRMPEICLGMIDHFITNYKSSVSHINICQIYYSVESIFKEYFVLLQRDKRKRQQKRKMLKGGSWWPDIGWTLWQINPHQEQNWATIRLLTSPQPSNFFPSLCVSILSFICGILLLPFAVLYSPSIPVLVVGFCVTPPLRGCILPPFNL